MNQMGLKVRTVQGLVLVGESGQGSGGLLDVLLQAHGDTFAREIFK